jgi:hypothetical protein
VNSHYVFTDEHYPTLKKLEGDERTVFALKHSLLHLQKSINHLRKKETARLRPEYDTEYRMYVVKTLINIIKLAEIVGFTAETFAAIAPCNSELSLSRIVENMMQEIATDCESFDHHGILKIDMLQMSVSIAWEYIIADSGTFTTTANIFTLNDALNYIPHYMKSAEPHYR